MELRVGQSMELAARAVHCVSSLVVPEIASTRDETGPKNGVFSPPVLFLRRPPLQLSGSPFTRFCSLF